jgi:V/A-type H+-transporting ATPase subunit C
VATVDLSDYGYVNARVRGMRSHLLTKEFFVRLVESGSFEDLHSMLETTVYRREINEAILVHPERPDYDQALSLNLIGSFRKIHDSTGGEAHRLVTVLLSKYDLLNVKSVLRGKKGNATPSEIASLLIPVGSIRMDALEQMAQEREIRDVINTMNSLQIKYAKPLLATYPEYLKKDQDLAILEVALDKYHYLNAMESLSGKRGYGRDKNVEMVREMISGEIDMKNISTLVRLRGLKLDDEEVENFRIPGGMLSEDQFLSLHRLGDIVQLVSDYPDPRYRKLLEKALSEYQEVDLVAFDRELEHELTRRAVAMSNVDVLSIGVIIGFQGAKENEIINLRVVLKGKNMDQPQAEIRKDLFFVEREDAEAA